MAVSVALIYIALVLQFKNASQALLVFAAIPYGMSERWPPRRHGPAVRVHVLPRRRQPVGVIVSHVIVLFDFIEKRTTRDCRCAMRRSWMRASSGCARS